MTAHNQENNNPIDNGRENLHTITVPADEYQNFTKAEKKT
jgi:hypothetical protein